MFSTSYRHMFILYSLLQSSIFHCCHTVMSYIYLSSKIFNISISYVYHPSIALLSFFYLIIYTVNIDGCLGGDLVQDTPPENEPYSGCDPNNVPDTCPSQPGLDPIHNYMDYSDDVCLTGRWYAVHMYIQ